MRNGGIGELMTLNLIPGMNGMLKVSMFIFGTLFSTEEFKSNFVLKTWKWARDRLLHIAVHSEKNHLFLFKDTSTVSSSWPKGWAKDKKRMVD